MPTILPKFIELGLQPNRVRLLDHADLLTRVQDGFDLLRQGKISGERLVVKVQRRHFWVIYKSRSKSAARSIYFTRSFLILPVTVLI